MTTTMPALPAGWRENPELAARVRAQLLKAKRDRTPLLTFSSPGDLAQALDPSTVQTPALELIDRELVDVADGNNDRLIITMPPQEGKSERVSHYFVLWMLIRNPDMRVGILSYSDEIASVPSIAIRTDVQTFDGRDDEIDLGLRLNPVSKSASRWNLAGTKGLVLARGLGSGLTGRRLDALIIDDPAKDFKSVDSERQNDNVWQWWTSVAQTRFSPGTPVVLILTRWSETDLAGRLLAKQAADEKSGEAHYDRWRVINIPAQADHDPNKGETDPLGREPGEYMISARGRTAIDWDRKRVAVGTRTWNALYQGRPSPAEGNVWKRPWWRRYRTPLWSRRVDGERVTYELLDVDESLMSWDMAFKSTNSSDYVVGQVWARRGADVFLLEQIRARMTFTETITAFKAMCARWPGVSAKVVEDKANGSAVIDSLHREIPGIIAENPTDSTEGRANAVAPFIEAGNVNLPGEGVELIGETDPEILISEGAAFPNGAHDDTVDATSQAIKRLLLDGAGAAAWLAWLTSRVAGQTTAPRDDLADAATVAEIEPPKPAEPEPVTPEPDDPLAALRAAKVGRVHDPFRRT